MAVGANGLNLLLRICFSVHFLLTQVTEPRAAAPAPPTTTAAAAAAAATQQDEGPQTIRAALAAVSTLA